MGTNSTALGVFRVACVLLAAVICTTTVDAATITWNGSADNSFLNAANWTGGSGAPLTDFFDCNFHEAGAANLNVNLSSIYRPETLNMLAGSSDVTISGTGGEIRIMSTHAAKITTAATSGKLTLNTVLNLKSLPCAMMLVAQDT